MNDNNQNSLPHEERKGRNCFGNFVYYKGNRFGRFFSNFLPTLCFGKTFASFLIAKNEN